MRPSIVSEVCEFRYVLNMTKNNVSFVIKKIIEPVTDFIEKIQWQS